MQTHHYVQYNNINKSIKNYIKALNNLRVRSYKTASFRGYFLGARAVLDIFLKFAPGMEE